ncbi:hypothetical protein MPDQ_005949 [Monascus purpureus]|uniref:alpha-amylase n=1 Tax=Monascus purpureus TaxID=5098 RepID=A0A507QZJ4_MONPU|nr:hypothetical protein MPDQ_005949 [Monascus purpureus]
MTARKTRWTVCLFIVSCALAFTTASAATKEQWRHRSVYQIVTDRFARSDDATTAPCNAAAGNYCGGSFRGIIDRLDYIQDLGFSAVWISPVTYQIQKVTSDLSAYHGYWQEDLYRINPSFGTPDDLKALSAELHARGMYLMVDVVVNDLAWAGNYTSIDYSQFNPFNSPEYFHPFRLLSDDFNNSTCVTECWLGDETVSLPDLKTEDHVVASMLYSWVSELVSNYSMDGLRLDSIFNVDQQFWHGFNSSAGVFCLGEGSTQDASSLCPLQWSIDGLLNYPLYHRLTATFNNTETDMAGLLEEMSRIKSQCKDVFSLGTFTENQDVPRFASYTKDISLAKNIITYNILGDGIPVLYYGEEQHFDGAYNPVNREPLWSTGYDNTSTPLPALVQSLNRIRSYAIQDGQQYTEDASGSREYATFVSYPIYNTSHVVALRKGYAGNQVVAVLSNLGSNPSSDSSETSLVLSTNGTGFHPGQNVTEILSCESVLTDSSSGDLRVSLSDGGPRVFYPSKSLNNSGICGRKYGATGVRAHVGSADDYMLMVRHAGSGLQF